MSNHGTGLGSQKSDQSQHGVHGGIILVGFKIHGGENSPVGKWHLAGVPKKSINILLPQFFSWEHRAESLSK